MMDAEDFLNEVFEDWLQCKFILRQLTIYIDMTLELRIRISKDLILLNNIFYQQGEIMNKTFTIE